MAPPCETFSPARLRLPGETYGPCALRGHKKPELYGLPDLSIEDKETCRKGTLLAVRPAAVAGEFSILQLPWILENP